VFCLINEPGSLNLEVVCLNDERRSLNRQALCVIAQAFCLAVQVVQPHRGHSQAYRRGCRAYASGNLLQRRGSVVRLKVVPLKGGLEPTLLRAITFNHRKLSLFVEPGLSRIWHAGLASISSQAKPS
jgi:hypothetical protein